MCDASSSPRGRFGLAFADLVRTHRYDVNTLNALAFSPLSLASFDFRLAFMAYHILAMAVPELVLASQAAPISPLIPLNKDESRVFRSRLQRGIQRYWNGTGATVTVSNNGVPFGEAIYRLYTGTASRSDAEWQLRRFPPDLVDWPSLNSQRLDVRLSHAWLRECSVIDAGCTVQVVAGRSLPADEAFSHGSADFVTEPGSSNVDGGSGRRETAPNPWLLVYWMRRYYAPLQK